MADVNTNPTQPEDHKCSNPYGPCYHPSHNEDESTPTPEPDAGRVASSMQNGDDYAAGIAYIVSHRNTLLRYCAGPTESFVVGRTLDALATSTQQGGEPLDFQTRVALMVGADECDQADILRHIDAWKQHTATRAEGVDAAMVERGVLAAESVSDARLPRHKVVRAILEAALADAQGEREVGK